VAVRLAIMTPTYNERANIDEFLTTLRATEPDADVYIVDDASPDGTGIRVAEHAAKDARIHLISRQGPRGYAAASREGLQRIAEGPYDAVVSIDCDFSHDPNAISSLVREIDSGSDIVVGSRYVPGGGIRNWSLFRRVLSTVGNRYSTWILGLPVRDCTSGFRAYRIALVRSGILSHTTSSGYAFLTESLLRIHTAGTWRISEVPIVYVQRGAGQSKMSRKIIIESMIRVTGWGLRRLGRP
jgi:dolichol-phosphate mannosyltransferase